MRRALITLEMCFRPSLWHVIKVVHSYFRCDVFFVEVNGTIHSFISAIVLVLFKACSHSLHETRALPVEGANKSMRRKTEDIYEI
jgi:hypothetical protein